MPCARTVLLLLTMLVIPAVASAADWPAYRRDAARSAVTDEAIPLGLTPQWTVGASQPPAPAWPEPGRSANLLDFDTAFQPVAAGGLVYFASSADDSVRALDAATGKQAWIVTTGGPVRFAPHIADGKCYFASDDGRVYCRDARTGAEVWTFRAALNDRQLLAHGRMVSRWPCRSGVLVRAGKVYVTAGMWPSEGVFLYALDAQTGKVQWCNDTSSYDYLNYPHPPSSSFGGPAPQGYLLAGQDVLVVPTGRAMPAGFDARTGRLLYFEAMTNNRGGTSITLAGETLFASTTAWQPDQSVRLGEGAPQAMDSLAAIDLKTGKETWAYSAAFKELVEEGQTRWRSQIAAGVLARQRAVFSGQRFFAMGNGSVDAFEFTDAKSLRRLWAVSHGRVYAEALTPNALLLGSQDAITALDPQSGKTLWRAAVDGQARGIAVADGRVLVSTERGTLHCFGAGDAPAKEPVRRDGIAPAPTAATAAILRQLPGGAGSKGFALVVGAPDARLGQQLAEQTGMHVICVLTDAGRAVAERNRLIGDTNLYGTRLAVVSMPAEQKRLPFVPYFANLVVVAGESVAGAELYRALRPCGGVMSFADAALAERLIRDADAPRAEVRSTGADTHLVRGKLAGAFDWNSKAEADERVRWPLEFLWFGEPGCQLLVARHQRPRTPVPANGRLFVFGETHIIALDAYNGTELWRRRVSQGLCTREGLVSADDDHVYLHDNGAVFKLDARTGKLLSVSAGDGKADPALPVHDARRPQEFAVKGKQGDGGMLRVETIADGLCLTLTTSGTVASRNDRWELAFDFRPAEQRTLPPGPGTFELVVDAWSGTLRRHATFAHPAIAARKTSAAGAAASVITVTIPFSALEKHFGKRPTDFALAADLKLWTEDFRQRLGARPLTDGKLRLLNEAEALFTLTDPAPRVAGQLSPLLPVALARRGDLPAQAREAGRMPPLSRKRLDGDYSADFKATLPSEDMAEPPMRESILRRAKGYELLRREQPLTGEEGVRDYTRSYGCSGTICSAVMDFFRSGTIGMYDRLDDAGMRNISGIRSGCGMTIVPAFGLLTYTESASDCLCSYSFATSLALVPADDRRNEDWALFDDKQLTRGLVRRAALNLGAPGDRRDADDVLWLGYPRPPLAVTKGTALLLPYTLQVAAGFGPYRINTDRQPITGTDRPWVYGSGIKGLTRLSLDLLHHQPQKMLLSLAGGAAPTIDGRLTDACWDGFGAVPLPERHSTAYFRHDAKNLYVAYEQKPRRDILDRRIPWKAAVAGKDGTFEKDDHVRVSFRNSDGQRIATFAVTAGGGTYDALLDYGMDIPALDGITVDGKPDDWRTADRQRGSTVALPGGATLRVGWSREGLLLLAEVPADFGAGKADRRVLYLALTTPGGATALQAALDLKAGTVETVRWQGAQAVVAKFPAVAQADKKTITLEALLPWDGLEFKPAAGTTVGLLVRVGDVDSRKSSPLEGRKEQRLGRTFALRLRAEDGTATLRAVEQRRANGGADIVPTASDDPAWNGSWTARATTDDTGFRGELAIPWQTLEAAGLSRARLELELTAPGRWGGAQPLTFAAYEKTAVEVQAVDQPPPARTFTVRLHFAEVEDVAVGERVFDVILQGRTVLKDFDVAQAADGSFRAVVKEFPDINADRQLDVRLVPRAAKLTQRNAPILSGIEVIGK